MQSVVAIVRCPTYDPALLDKALAQAAELAPLPEVRGASLLLKPNILNAALPEQAVTTHPQFLGACIRLLRSRGAARIAVGDSPSWQAQDLAGRRSGIKAAVEAEGALWTDFSEGAEYECAEGRRVKRFTLAKALGEADFLVSLPKLKTHRLVRYTGAIKNLFGLVPSLGKSAFHLRFPDPEDFGAMLVDLALATKPAFSLMDAVVAMEGHGPNNGKPKELGLVLASRDPLALDWTAAGLIGYEPSEIGYLADAAARGVWAGGAADIEIRGERPEEVAPASFELVRATSGGTDIFASRIPAFLHRIVKNMSVPRPFFDHAKCEGCGACVRICPPRALAFIDAPGAGKRVAVDRAKCIRCYCCDEVCPADAISLRRRPW